MLNFDLVNIPIGSQIKKSYSLSFQLKKASTLLIETKNFSISNKVADLCSLRNFQYNGKIILFEKDIKLLNNQEIKNYRKNISIAGNYDALFNNMSIINNITIVVFKSFCKWYRKFNSIYFNSFIKIMFISFIRNFF